MPLKRNRKKARSGKYFEQKCFVVRGSYHQGNNKFSELSRGKQCVPNSVLSVVYDKFKPVSEWKSTDLDCILIAGDCWYRNIQINIQTDYDFLLIDEIPTTGQAFGESFSITFGDVYSGKVIGTESGIGDMVLDLCPAIEKLGVSVQSCVLTIDNSAIGLLARNGSYYVFDSHSRSAKGLAIAYGKSIRTKFDDIDHVKTFLLNLTESLGGSDNTYYEMTPVDVKIANSHANCVSVKIPTDSVLSQNKGDGDPSFSCTVAETIDFDDLKITDEKHDEFLFQFLTIDSCNSICHKFNLLKNNTQTAKIVKVIKVRTAEKSPSKIQRVLADGNCFFRAIDTALTGNDNDNHMSLRSAIVNHLIMHNDQFAFAVRGEYKTALRQIKERNMNSAGSWATELDIFGAADLLNINIYTFIKDKWHKYSPINTEKQLGNLYLSNNNYHYEVVRDVYYNESRPETKYERRIAAKRKCENNRYHENEHVKKIKIMTSRERYHSDDQFQEEVKTYSKSKYINIPKFAERVKNYSKAKYKHNPKFAEEVKNYSKAKYKNEPTFAEEVKNYSKAKYKNEPTFAEEVKNYSKAKYKNEPNFAKNVITYSKNKYHLKKIFIEGTEQLIKDFHEFSKNNFPEFICVICIRLLFRNQVIRMNENEKKCSFIKPLITTEYYHKCNDDCDNSCNLKNNIDSVWWICYNCKRKLQKNEIPHESFKNAMNPGPIPNELLHLNSIEKHLIALNLPFLKLLSLPKGGQFGVHGPVISVPSNVQTTTTILPRVQTSDKLIHVKLKRKLQYKGHYKFEFVDKQKILDALKFLKQNNSFYKHIKIDNNWVNSLEKCQTANSDSNSDSDLSDSDTSEDGGEVLGNVNNTCLQPIDIGENFLDFDFDQILSLAPAEGNKPVSMITESGNEAKAFPCIFPTGQNSFDSERLRLTASRYFHCRLMSADPRWAQFTEYIFFAQFVTELLQVQSSVSIALRKGRTLDHKNIKVSELIKGDHLQKAFLHDDAFKFLNPIRGTPQFWHRAQRDLFAMVRQIGVPTWFCSFSSADMRWPEFVEVILRNNQDMRKYTNLSWAEKAELIRNNPVTVARMFQHRFNGFLKNVILSNSAPIGKVIDFFYRVEFQMRGSPHIHAVFWVEGAPKYGVDKNIDVVNFIDKYVTCRLPDSNDPFYEVVSNVQKHSTRHSKSCRKKGTVCRFNFPRPPSNRTFISDNKDNDDIEVPNKSKLKEMYQSLTDPINTFSDVNAWFQTFQLDQITFENLYTKHSKQTSVVLKREPGDVWVNGYNETLLKCWNANMDIQFVLDPYACVVYILSYISKSERELSILMQSLKNDSDLIEQESKIALNKLGSLYLQNREVSAQESTYRVCNLTLKECSRKVEFVPIGRKQIRLSLPIADLKRMCEKNENINASDIWASNLVEKYKSRPKSNEFEAISLAEFTAQYRVISSTEAKNTTNYITLNNKLGHIKKRTKTQEAIIRYPRVSKQEHPEDYYRNMLQLFLPHYHDKQLLPNDFLTYEDFYEKGYVKLLGKLEQVKTVVKGGLYKFEKNTEINESVINDVLQGHLAEDAWALLGPETAAAEDENLKSKTMLDIEEGELEIPDLAPPEDKSFRIECKKVQISDKQGINILRSLNHRQRLIFYKIRDWSIRSTCGEPAEPFYVFVTGGGGTGKSHLINAVYFESEKIFRKYSNQPQSHSVLLTASTGIAAYNIGGTTLHSAFKIPGRMRGKNSTDGEYYIPLGQDMINTLRSSYINLRLLIIDEISMVSDRLLYYVSCRLQQIKQNNKLLFGGVSVLAVGDFYQLPPVKEKTVYYENAYGHLWTNFKIAELNEVMRQKDDDELIEILNFIRTKLKAQELPQKYLTILEGRNNAEISDDAMRIFATNKEVNAYNEKMLDKSCKTIYELRLLNVSNKSKPHKTSIHSDAMLPLIIKIGINARVMLTKNVNLSDGLINGAFGTIKDITQNEDNEVAIVWVDFDKLKIGCQSRALYNNKNGNLTPIIRREESIKGIRLSQFPLALAWGCTVHKTQGLTLDKALISMKSFFLPGQAYVALSRVKSLDGLAIQHFKPNALYCNDNISQAINSMPSFLLMPPRKVNQNRVVFLNVESLQAHFNDVIQDIYTWGCGIVAMCETNIESKISLDSFAVKGYNFKNKSRKNCYNNNHNFYAKTSGGGVGLYFSQHANIRFKSDLLYDIEYMSFYHREFDVYFTVIYRPPSYKKSSFLTNVKKMINEINQHSTSIILGDFNENLMNTSTSTEIRDFFASVGYIQLVHRPTTDQGTLIDHIYCKNLSKLHLHVDVRQTYYSYHQAIILTIL